MAFNKQTKKPCFNNKNLFLRKYMPMLIYICDSLNKSSPNIYLSLVSKFAVISLGFCPEYILKLTKIFFKTNKDK